MKKIKEKSYTGPYYLFIIVVFFTFFAVVGIVFIRTQNILRKHILNELALSIKSVSGKVSTFIEGKKGRVLDFCSDGIIKDGLTYYDPDDSNVSVLADNTNNHLVRNKLSLDPYLQDILILNLKGRVVFSTDKRWLGEDKSKEDYFLAVSKYFKDDKMLKKLKGEPGSIVYTSDFYVSADYGMPVLAISNIVTGRATGLPLGVLVNRYKGDCLNRFLKTEEALMGKSGKVYIVNKEGLLLTVPKFMDLGEKESMFKKKMDINMAIRAWSDSPWILGTYKDFRGEAVLGASMLMDENNWIILAEQDAKEVFSPLYQLTFQIIVIGIISLAIVVGVSSFIGHLQRNIDEKNRQLEESRMKMYQSGKMAAVGQVASSIAHEISNPLVGVLNNVQLMKMNFAQENSPDSRYTKLLNTIEESALRCSAITRSLLDFSRSAKVEFKEVVFNEVVEKAIVLVAPELKAKNILIQKQLQPGLPNVLGEPQLLQQAVFDILNNALYAIGKKSEAAGGGGNSVIAVKTRYEPESRRIHCSISDTGMGISKENLEKLFTPFFTTKPAGEGTGLGLSFVNDIILRHSGKIQVKSEAGKGTIFTLLLPAVAGK